MHSTDVAAHHPSLPEFTVRTGASEDLGEDSRVSSLELSILAHVARDTCPQRVFVFACCIVYRKRWVGMAW